MYISFLWHVFTLYVHVFPVYRQFILVINMFQHVYTLYIQIQRYSYMVYTGSNVYIQFFHKIKKKYNIRTWTNDLMHTSKLPQPLCYQCDWQWAIVANYIYIVTVTCRLMSHVWCRILCAPRPCGPPHWRHPPGVLLPSQRHAHEQYNLTRPW